MESRSVDIATSEVMLSADLTVPEEAEGVVLFAHGSGSGRFSPRNRLVAKRLNDAGFATVLADLLTEEEERQDRVTGALRFDIGLLAGRMIDLVDWTDGEPSTAAARIGLFGASTGAAAALIAAAERPGEVTTVVSRGGRPDLAGQHLTRVRQPVLLIVGGADLTVLDLNRRAMRAMPGQAHLEIVPGAGHLFEEPGTLERVATLASAWFGERLASSE